MLVILDKKYEVVGVLSNSSPKACPYFNDLFTEALANNRMNLEFDVAANHPSASLLENEGFVIYTDMDGKKHLLVIKEIVDTHNAEMIKTVYCESSLTGDLLGDIVRPTILTSNTIEQALNTVLDGTGWTLDKVDITGAKDIEFEDHITVLEAVHTILNEFEAELETQVVFNGSTVVGKTLSVKFKRGQKTGKIFEYSKDMTEVTKTENSMNLVTALIAIGKDDLKLTGYYPASEPGYPLRDDYIIDEEAFQRFGRGGKHIFGVYSSNAENQGDLYAETIEKLKELSKPKLTYECRVVALEKISKLSHERVRIGDTIVVKDFSYVPALILEARVMEIKRSITDPLKDEVVLGDYVTIDSQKSSAIIDLQRALNEQKSAIELERSKVQDIETVLDGNITSDNIKLGSVVAGSLTPQTITKESGVIAPDAITSTEIADSAVGTNQIASGSIDSTKIGYQAIKTENIAHGVITADNLQNGTITGEKLQLGAVSANKLNLSTHILT